MKFLLVFTKCSDCNVDIKVHAYDLTEANALLIDAIERHMSEAHYVGEPVPFAAVMMVEACA